CTQVQNNLSTVSWVTSDPAPNNDPSLIEKMEDLAVSIKQLEDLSASVQNPKSNKQRLNRKFSKSMTDLHKKPEEEKENRPDFSKSVLHGFEEHKNPGGNKKSKENLKLKWNLPAAPSRNNEAVQVNTSTSND